MSSPERSQLRKQLRAERNAFIGQARLLACKSICEKVISSEEFQASNKIALYWPNDGEPETQSLFDSIWAQQKAAYLPILKDKGSRELSFMSFTKETQLTENLYGIPEPSKATEILLIQLDLILMPLVGFDETGNRLGMGGGFYDATLAPICVNKTDKPKLMGLAFECQKLTAGEITAQDWDVPMDAVVTEEQFYRFS